MTYRALNTVTTADAEHTRKDIIEVGLLNLERQSLSCHFSSTHHCMLYIFDVVSPTC